MTWVWKLEVAACLSTSMAVLVACGSDDTSGGGAAGKAGGGSGGSAGTAGSTGGTGAAGGDAAAGTGGCPDIAPSGDGTVLSAVVVGAQIADSLDAACDGSFMLTGAYTLVPISFDRGDGTSIVLEPPEPEPAGQTPSANFIARYDAAGHAVWAKRYWTGSSGGGGRRRIPKLFPDGSAVLAGFYGSEITLGVGEPGETTIQTLEHGIEGFIARYDPDGTLLWAKRVTGDESAYDNTVGTIAAAPDGTTYALVSNWHVTELVVGPGELDLPLAQNDYALVAIDRDGHFTHGVRLQGMEGTANHQLVALPDGGVLSVNNFAGGAIIAPGTPAERTISESGVGYARFSSTLALESLVLVDGVGDAFYSVPLSDSSVVFARTTRTASLTLGAGEPNEVTFESTGVTTDYVFVAHFDPDGTLSWATQLTHPQHVVHTTLAALPDGSAWVAGYVMHDTQAVEGTLTVGPATSRPLTLVTSPTRYRFIARFDPDGTPAWVLPLSGDGSVHFNGMAGSPLTTVLLGEKHPGAVTFGEGGPTISDLGVAIVRLGP
jgi:hypothetical protein